MYPKNAASPPRIAIGAVVQISDGAVQSSGVSVAVRPEGGAESAGGGTIAYGASSSIVYYTPTQAETNYTTFVVTAYKTGCIPISQTVVTTAESTAGKVSVGSSQSFDNSGQTTNLPAALKAIIGTTLTETSAGYLSAAFKKLFDVSTPVLTAASIDQTGDSYAIVNSGTFGNSALKTLIDAVDNFVDTEIADIQSRLPAALVGGRMDASVGAMAANSLTASALATDAVTEMVDGVWLANSVTYGYTATTMGRVLHNGGIAVIDTTASGTPSTTQIQLAVGSSTNDFYNDMICFVDSGTGAGQASPILDYDGATKTITLDEALAVAPANGDQIVVRCQHVHPRSQIAASVRDVSNASPAGGSLGANIASALADTNELQIDWADGGRLDLILDARASQASVDTIDNFLDTEIAAILEDTGTTLPAQISALFTTALTESYRADGATGTPAQILYELLALNGEFSISGTTKQHKQIDGTTNAFASTLNDATNPTAITRA